LCSQEVKRTVPITVITYTAGTVTSPPDSLTKPDICRLSKDDFLFQQDEVPAYHSRYTVAHLRSLLPEFTEPENWPPIV